MKFKVCVQTLPASVRGKPTCHSVAECIVELIKSLLEEEAALCGWGMSDMAPVSPLTHCLTSQAININRLHADKRKKFG